MNPDELTDALDRFARDLTVAGEPAVFDAVVARHLPLLLDLRRAGLRWSGVLRLLSRAGARRPDGTDLSADQLRASISRARRGRGERPVAGEQPRPNPFPPGSALPALASADIMPSPLPPPPTPPTSDRVKVTAVASVQPTPPATDPDLTAAELDAARRRLR